MSKIAIIHFAPLEFYPPIQNLLNELAREGGKTTIEVFTTRPVRTVLLPFGTSSDQIKLTRIGKSDMRLSPFLRYINYFLFFSSVLLRMLRCRYKKVMYFETISSWPAYVYKRFFDKACEIFIHYHEYTSREEYRHGMKLVRYFHRLESWLYPRAVWVSHTNAFRMDRFKEDIYPDVIHNPQIVPNYPPLKWRTEANQISKLPLRVVYVGALSLSTMFVEKFATWILGQEGRVTWDLYSYNVKADVPLFFERLNTPWINLKPGIDYDQLPAILREYNVGVILYKGHIPNYVLNAPNKLFEYLACGLDVWFPEVMTGSMDYVNKNGFPKVISIDFNNLNKFDMVAAIERQGSESKYLFFCEEALKPLIDKLTQL